MTAAILARWIPAITATAPDALWRTGIRSSARPNAIISGARWNSSVPHALIGMVTRISGGTLAVRYRVIHACIASSDCVMTPVSRVSGRRSPR
jgi:hypothetical protein